MRAPPPQASARAFGPIVVPRYARLPADRGPYTRPHIDISAHRGLEIGLGASTIGALCGSGKAGIHALMDEGVLQEVIAPGQKRRRYALFDPGRDLTSYCAEWIERTPAPTTQASFELYRTVRRRCHVDAGVPHSEKILEAVFQKLKWIGNFTRHEVNGLIPLLPGSWASVSEWLNRRFGTYARERHSLGDEVPVAWELFAAALPAEFSILPRTCLDPDPRNQRDRPSPRVRHRAWRLSELFDTGALYAIVYTARLRRPDELRPAMVVISRVEEIMTTHAPDGRWTADTYREAMWRYAVDCDILPDDSPGRRHYTVRYWRIILDRLFRYCRQHDPKGVLSLRRRLPPRFRISSQLRRELNDRYGGLRQEGRQRRKSRTHQAFGQLDEIIDAAIARTEEMKALGDALRAAEDLITDDQDFVDFAVDVPSLDERGVALDGYQEEVFRLWRISAAWRSFPIDDGPHNRTRTAVGARNDSGFSAGTIVEHLQTRGRSGEECYTSWMVALATVGAFSCPASLPLHVREKREIELRRRSLPGFRTHGPGVLGFDQERATLARNGMLYGRSFVPLAEMEAAIRFGNLALQCVTQSYSRLQELQQLERLNWQRKHLLPGAIHMSQEVWPKIERGVDLVKSGKVSVTVTADIVDEALDLCALHVERFGFLKFPTMPAAHPIRWKCGPAEYIFAWAGQALLAGWINLFVRYLLVGWPEFKLHDFRHTGAEEAEFDDEPTSAIQIALGQKSSASTKTYTELVHWAREIKQARSDERKAERLDERRHDQGE